MLFLLGVFPVLGCGFHRSLGRSVKGGVLTGNAAFGVTLDEPRDVGRERLAEAAFACDLLTRFVNRIL